LLLFFWGISVIAFVEGNVLFIEPGWAVIKTGGVGYQIMLSKKDLENLHIGHNAAIFVYTNVREDALELYGFMRHQDKQIFQLLIGVSGVGPKLALVISSALSSHQLVNALIQKDLALLSSIPGIGKKTAERLCLELKDKVLKLELSSIFSHEEASNTASLTQAIRGLGYSKEQSDRAIASIAHDDLLQLPLEILVKKTLAYLTGKNPHDHN
jgi:Holliday junction DNA helicase RuvA